ncbi:MAG: protein kinase [Polyangiales bacterium]
MFEPGDKIGRYTVLQKLKEGGMATLFLCSRRGAAGKQKHVAIKVIHAHLSQDEHFRQMLVDEAVLASQIQHPNVVHVEELGEVDGKYFLVMEYVHGCTLSQLLRALARARRRMRPEIASRIAVAVAEGLHAAHETRGLDGELLGVVHRDVTPENIMINESGQVKLIDFGVAKFRDRVAKNTAGGIIKGKFSYMAPEQANDAAVDRRTDVYQLGIVLWEMLTMRRCFKGEVSLEFLDRLRNPTISPPSKYFEALDPKVDQVVMKGLSRDSASRPSSARAFSKLISEAVPEAAIVSDSDIADLVNTMLGDELEQHRKALPSELMAAEQGAQPFDHDEVLRTMTVDTAQLSASGPLSGGDLSGSFTTGSSGSDPWHAETEVDPSEPWVPSRIDSQAPDSPDETAVHGKRRTQTAFGLNRPAASPFSGSSDAPIENTPSRLEAAPFGVLGLPPVPSADSAAQPAAKTDGFASSRRLPLGALYAPSETDTPALTETLSSPSTLSPAVRDAAMASAASQPSSKSWFLWATLSAAALGVAWFAFSEFF